MIYWEDVTVGESMSLGSRLVGASEIVSFARQYDPQVFHLDAEAAVCESSRATHRLNPDEKMNSTDQNRSTLTNPRAFRHG